MSSTISHSTTNYVPTIGITMGDPAGIGPEICLKLIDHLEDLEDCKLVIFGDATVLEKHSRFYHRDFTNICLIDTLDDKPSTSFALFNVTTPEIGLARIGEVSETAGIAAFNFLMTAIRAAKQKQIDAIVTGPINKLAFKAAGVEFPGHTELLAQEFDTEQFCMMQYSDEITCSFVTTHIGYQQVAQQLSPERILQVIQLTDNALTNILQRKPNLIVCGLNPHAGESGLFGDLEEERFIVPAIESAKSLGIQVEGPLPPDTCFIPSKRESTDGYICMYHDQGHIPLKALAFDKAVNTTLGLPVIRTSVDHGTAFDIAGSNQANPGSLLAAIKLAAKLAKRQVDQKLRYDGPDPRDSKPAYQSSDTKKTTPKK